MCKLKELADPADVSCKNNALATLIWLFESVQSGKLRLKSVNAALISESLILLISFPKLTS